MATIAEKILLFLKALKTPAVPSGIAVMNPYQEDNTFKICERFYRKFYSDCEERTLILGINPGRFGGGITGIPFTDPIKLETFCGIDNDLQKKAELSADFIYLMINALGGPEKFYRKFYISAISPLGFTKEGKNLNYYDVKELQNQLTDFIVSSLRQQLEFCKNETAYCLGEGQNYKFLLTLNKKYNFFNQVVPLAHPRFVMQYKRKKVDEYIRDYADKLNAR